MQFCVCSPLLSFLTPFLSFPFLPPPLFFLSPPPFFFSPVSAPTFLDGYFRKHLLAKYLGSIWLDQAGMVQGLAKPHWCPAMLIVSIIELWRVPETDFINPTISRSTFVATSTIPVSLTMPTFSWHRVWPPVISQQKLASTTQWWRKTALQATNCRVHPCWNEQHIPKRSTEVQKKKKKEKKNAKSLRGASNPLGHQTSMAISPALKTGWLLPWNPWQFWF